MDVDHDESILLNKALDTWVQSGDLSPDQATALRKTINTPQKDRQQIAKYFFFIALFCTLLAFAAIFLNEKLLEKVKLYFSWSNQVIAGISALLALVWFWYVGRHRKATRSSAWEIYMSLGGLAALTAIVYCCKILPDGPGYSVAVFSMSTVALGCLGGAMGSYMLWFGAVISFVSLLNMTGIYFQHNNLFLGMNYPLRNVVFGGLLLAIALAQQRVARLRQYQVLTYLVAMLLFFVAFWSLSVFGNFNSFERWQQARQQQVLIYSVFLAAATVLSFYLGIRYKDKIARDFGVLFFLINLYTRFFEYFWDTMNKGIFFLVLAVTFGLLGRYLEKQRKARNEDDSLTPQ